MNVYKFQHYGTGPLGGNITVIALTENKAKKKAVQYIENLKTGFSTPYCKGDLKCMVESLELLSSEPVKVNTVIDFYDGEY